MNNQTVSLTRDNRNVYMSMPGFDVTFDTYYGGAPLYWYAVNGSTKTLVTNPFAGCGTSVNWVFGQDPTQASPNGPAYFPISTLTNPNPSKAFFARELQFTPPSATQPNAVYQLSGYAPIFWISLYDIDDSIPNNPSYADHGWVTLYHNIANIPTTTFESFGTPIFYQGGSNHPEGIILAGNKMLPGNITWNQRMAMWHEGRFSCQVRISLKQVAQTDCAGIVFRRQMPTSSGANYTDAYNSPGYTLLVNGEGVLEIQRFDGSGNPPQTVWGGNVINQVAQAVNTDEGVMLDLRVDNNNVNTVQISAQGQYLDSYTDNQCILGSNFGLYANSSTSTGLIQFAYRYFFDISKEFNATYTGKPDGTLEFDVTIANSPGVTTPQNLYRTAQPGVFISESISNPVLRAWQVNGDEINLNQAFPYPGTQTFSGIAPILRDPSYVYSMFIGTADGTAGAFCIPMLSQINGQNATESHAGLMNPVLTPNALPFSANQVPVSVTSARVISSWRPYLPENLR